MAVGHYNPVWHRLILLRLANCFLPKPPPLQPFEAHSISTENMGTGEHKIQKMEMIYNTNTQPVFRHTQPKSMEAEADDGAHCNNRLSFYPCVILSLFLYPLWAGKWAVTVAPLITGQEAEWHGINHSFVLLSWHIKLESSGGPDDRGERWEGIT